MFGFSRICCNLNSKLLPSTFRISSFKWTQYYHTSPYLKSKPKKRIPDSSLVGHELPLPAFILAKDLAKKLSIDVDRVEKFGREENLAFKKASDLILDFPRASRFVSSFKIIPKYEEIDATRSDYWNMAAIHQCFNTTRPSVIAVMGEIDHGKTTLLDALSDSNVADHEIGKITQSISAFTIDLSPQITESDPAKMNDFKSLSSSRVTFLDTPGHGAFESMRLNGASVSDFILLVVSATEGIKPQTVKIMEMAKHYWVPLVIAINKIDIASQDQIIEVYKSLRKIGVSKIRRSKNVAMQKSAGEINSGAALFDDLDDDHPVAAIVEISAKERINFDILKNVIARLHESMIDNLHVDPNFSPSEATVIESFTAPGHGRVLLCIGHLGNLKVGSHFLTNTSSGVVKSLRIADSRHLSFDGALNNTSTKTTLSKDSSNQPNNATMKGSYGSTVSVPEIGPGLPVLISGLSSDNPIPSGSALFQFDSKEEVERIMNFRKLVIEFNHRKNTDSLFRTIPTGKNNSMIAKKRGDSESVDDTNEMEGEEEKLSNMEDIYPPDIPDEMKNNLSVIIKADNQGRLDAAIQSAQQAASEFGFSLKILHSGIGNATTHDMNAAQVELEENGVPRIPILLFNTSIDPQASKWMSKNPIASRAFYIKEHSVFLDIVNDIKSEIQLKLQRRNLKSSSHGQQIGKRLRINKKR